MTIQYKTKGVCSQQMNVKIEDGVVPKVEIGGGIRSLDALDAVFDAGVSRAILGTAAGATTRGTRRSAG